jgi:hypothetical protein
MPQNQKMRDLVARMKLIPVRQLIDGQRILFCEDSIVRGTQLRDNVQVLFEYGAKEVHMRPACPCLIHPCEFLNFSTSRSTLDLAGRTAIQKLEGAEDRHLDEYARHGSDKNLAMIDRITGAAAPDHPEIPESGRPGGSHRPAQGTAVHPLLGRHQLYHTSAAILESCNGMPPCGAGVLNDLREKPAEITLDLIYRLVY